MHNVKKKVFIFTTNTGERQILCNMLFYIIITSLNLLVPTILRDQSKWRLRPAYGTYLTLVI